MKNANIFVDVDLTLVDAQGRLLEGAKEALLTLREKGCHLFLWSSNGTDYAKNVASRFHIEDLFEGFAAKPDILIDDMPGTAIPAFNYSVTPGEPWAAVAGQIVRRHID